MLTIALTAAVLTLLVDKVIEPAQAQNCASQDDVEEQADRVIQRVLYCIDGSSVDGRLSTFCNY